MCFKDLKSEKVFTLIQILLKNLNENGKMRIPTAFNSKTYLVRIKYLVRANCFTIFIEFQ